VRVQITRRGGLAGVELSAELDTSKLDEETASRLEEVLEQLVARGADGTTRPRPDAFEYEIMLPERGQSARVSEPDLPRELRPLLQELKTKGKLQSEQDRETL
jgi:hypothetical protein